MAVDIIIMNKQVIGALGVGALIPLAFSLWSSHKQVQTEEAKWAGRVVGIELGGTNYNVAIAEPILNNKAQLIDFRIIKRKAGITYADPEQSLAEIIEFITAQQEVKEKPYLFIGIASFGPLCLKAGSPLYGSITTTPKELWRGIRLLERISLPFPAVPVGIDTDVNAAAYAEFKLGRHEVSESLAYITVGTGVGVGVIAGGKMLHGLTHPEGGHIVVERSPDEYEHFQGVCPYHKGQTCLESMVSNRSIADRLQVDFTALAELPDNARIWRLVGFYLAQLCLNITLLLSPEVIVIGGGIMNRKLLYSIIHEEFKRLLGGYVDHPLLSAHLDKYIVSPSLGSDVGVKGAMSIASIRD